ncbi:MAG: YqeG family HAD IIIA-type phosphatase [Bacilli bacterium]
MDYFFPDVYQKSIYTINYDKLKENGIKCLLFDLDNTCVPYVDKTPTKKLGDLFDKLTTMGFKVIIFSNSPKSRLEPFKKVLNVDCCASARKPQKNKFLKVLNTYNYDLSEVAIIGDQLMTDIYGGNKVGIMTILVNPMSDIDMPLTKIYRFIEKKKINKMTKKGIFKVGRYYD